MPFFRAHNLYRRGHQNARNVDRPTAQFMIEKEKQGS